MAEKNNDTLQDRWMKLTAGIDDDVKSYWWKFITSKYSDSSRKYHTLAHLKTMFQHLDSHISFIDLPNAMSYAIFFHDVEYDPQSQENEEESIKHFQKFSKDSGLEEDTELVSKVVELIQLSKTHCTEEHKTDDAFGKEDKHFFLDFDMSILGSSSLEYKEYATQIREEYNFLPSARYNFLRFKVLKSFLQIPNIYATKSFREKYEPQARRNIQEEIAQLEQGLSII